MDTKDRLEGCAPAPFHFNFGFQQHVPVGMCPWHHHPMFELVYRPAGRGVTTIESGEIPFGPESLCLYPPMTPHNQRNDVVGEDWCIHGQMTGVPPAAFRQCLFLNAIPVPAWQEDLKLLSTIARPLTGARALAYSYRLSALLLGLLEYAEGMGTEQILSMADRYVEQASSYLEEHVQTVTHLEEVADAVAISDDYLRHIFRAKTGVSLVNYLMRLRIERAKNLIRHSTLTLSAIANLSGFSNARYFATSFRRAVGCSPSAYRAGAAATVSVPQRNDKPTGE